jgi:hypothetical protein
VVSVIGVVAVAKMKASFGNAIQPFNFIAVVPKDRKIDDFKMVTDISESHVVTTQSAKSAGECQLASQM